MIVEGKQIICNIRRITMKGLLRTVKKRWNSYLKRMADTNNKLYGGKRLDCCELNREVDVQSKRNKDGDAVRR